MGRIKGEYKGNITITVDVDENKNELLPFDEMKERFTKLMTPYLQSELEYLIEEDGMATVMVEQISANVWREEDE